MNLKELLADRNTLHISAIVDHLIHYFRIQPNARELVLVLGDGTEGCPRDALRHWVIAQCRELAGQDIERPLQTVERRLADQLQEYGCDLSDLELPSPAAQRLRTQLPDPDEKLTIARRLRAVSDESNSFRTK